MSFDKLSEDLAEHRSADDLMTLYWAISHYVSEQMGERGHTLMVS